MFVQTYRMCLFIREKFDLGAGLITEACIVTIMYRIDITKFAPVRVVLQFGLAIALKTLPV